MRDLITESSVMWTVSDFGRKSAPSVGGVSGMETEDRGQIAGQDVLEASLIASLRWCFC